MYHAEQMVKSFIKSMHIQRVECGLPEIDEDEILDSFQAQKCIELYYAMIGREIAYTQAGDLWHSDDNLYRIVREALNELS
jgi:hypothetical protein